MKKQVLSWLEKAVEANLNTDRIGAVRDFDIPYRNDKEKKQILKIYDAVEKIATSNKKGYVFVSKGSGGTDYKAGTATLALIYVGAGESRVSEEKIKGLIANKFYGGKPVEGIQ